MSYRKSTPEHQASLKCGIGSHTHCASARARAVGGGASYKVAFVQAKTSAEATHGRSSAQSVLAGGSIEAHGAGCVAALDKSLLTRLPRVHQTTHSTR
eukprot:6193726-Pleurochrysis_carterae.AAC.1